TISDVCELMRKHASKLTLVQHIEYPVSDRNHRVFGVSPRGKGIGLRLMNHEYAGFWNSGPRRKVLNDGMKPWELRSAHLSSTVHGKNDAIGKEIGSQVHPKREN